MPKFNYVAMDTKGKEISGMVESESTTSAIGRIREMGYFPTNVTEVGSNRKAVKSPAAPAGGSTKATAKSGGKLQLKLFGGNKVKSKVLSAFTRQLATLIDAGLPLLRGLDVLRKQEKNPVLKRTLSQLAEMQIAVGARLVERRGVDRLWQLDARIRVRPRHSRHSHNQDQWRLAEHSCYLADFRRDRVGPHSLDNADRCRGLA